MWLGKSLRVFLAFILFILVVSACTPGKPAVVISSPPSGSTYREGDDVAIQSTSADQTGVVRVELTVDGAVVRNDTPPSPQTSFAIIQTWKATQGAHTVIVCAYNAAGAASDPAGISISVSAAAAAPANAPTQAPPTAVAQPATAIPPTAVPPTSPPTACTNAAAFVTDVTIPDGTVLAPGQSFGKTWRVKNTGTCAWTTVYDFAFVSGEAMATTTAIAVPNTAPGATADLQVAMVAPTTPGVHAGVWKLRNVGDTFFGGVLTVSINVIDTSAQQPPATAQPASAAAPPTATTQPPATGCTGAPNIASFTASPSNLAFGGGQITLSWGAVTNADSVEIDNGVGGVTTPGSTSVNVTKNTTFTLTATCGSNNTTAQAQVSVANVSVIQSGIKQVLPSYQLIFKVTSVTLTGGPTGKIVLCPRGYSFTAAITTNGSGSVTFHWERANGGTSDMTLNFASAGTKNVPYAYNAYNGDSNGWVQIHITQPNDLTSSKVNYSCVKF